MIECPICRVMNEDMARFCAECGQRLSGPAAPPAQPPAGQPPAGAAPEPASKPAKAPGPKLHSPLLGGDPGGGQVEDQRADFSRLRGGPSRASSGGDSGQPERSGKGLRSPLLGGGEPDMFPEPDPGAGRPKRGLKSPLLGGNEPEFEEPHGRPTPGRGGGLRSPLLGGTDADFDEPAAPKSGRGLRSPLLGGEPEFAEPAPQRPAGGGASARGGSLRSPLLGGTDAFSGGGGYEPEPEQPENPNVLRSPLLAAKVPMSERPAKPASPPPAPPQMPAQGGPSPSVNEAMIDAFTGGRPQQPGNVSPAYTPGYAPAQPAPMQAAPLPPAPQPVAYTPPTPQPVQPMPSAFAPSAQPAPAQPAPAPPAPAPAPQASSPYAPPVAPQQPPPAPSRYAPEPTPPAPQPEPERPASFVRPGRGRSTLDSEPPAETEARPRKRTSSKMISGDESELFDSAGPQGRFAAPPAPAPGSGISKILILPLVGALLEKGWIFTQVGGNQLYIIDTVASMVVIMCLIVLCATTGGRR